MKAPKDFTPDQRKLAGTAFLDLLRSLPAFKEMEEHMESLLKTYRDAEARVTKAEGELTEARTAKNAALKAIVDLHGLGPHDIDGEKKIIVRKGETLFFMKHTKGVKKK